VAAYFLVGNEKHGHGARQPARLLLALPCLKGGERVQHQGNAGLHIEDTGSGQPVVHRAAGHGSQRAQWIDGIVVAEQQHRLRGFATEVDLQVTAEILCAVEVYFPAEPGKFMRDGLRNFVHGGFVVARRFDCDQLADGRDNLVAALVEIGKTTLRFDA
jgi:hypothetical protein